MEAKSNPRTRVLQLDDVQYALSAAVPDDLQTTSSEFNGFSAETTQITNHAISALGYEVPVSHNAAYYAPSKTHLKTVTGSRTHTSNAEPGGKYH